MYQRKLLRLLNDMLLYLLVSSVIIQMPPLLLGKLSLHGQENVDSLTCKHQNKMSRVNAKNNKLGV